MKKIELSYNVMTGRYHGVQSNGTPVEIDADVFAEDRQFLEDQGMIFEDAYDAISDPDGWSAGMPGWIPADEHYFFTHTSIR